MAGHKYLLHSQRLDSRLMNIVSRGSPGSVTLLTIGLENVVFGERKGWGNWRKVPTVRPDQLLGFIGRSHLTKGRRGYG